MNEIAPLPPQKTNKHPRHLLNVIIYILWTKLIDENPVNSRELISWKYAKPLIRAYISNQDERICMFGSCLTHRGLGLVTPRIWCRRFYHHRRMISEKSFCLHGSIQFFLVNKPETPTFRKKWGNENNDKLNKSTVTVIHVSTGL